MAIVPGPPSLSFLLARSLERGRHLWGIGGDDPMDSAIRVVMKKEEGTWSVSPACSLRKLNLDRACEGNGFDVCVCVCGYWWLYDGLVGRVILLKVLF